MARHLYDYSKFYRVFRRMDSYSAICGMPTSTLNTPSCPTYGAQIKSRAVFLSMEKSCAYERTYTVFMIVAQKSRTVAQRTFWIDAICIDQGSTLEKNHQVAKMGLIYTKAQEVVAWLGFSRAISRALAFCTASTSQNYETVGEAREFWDRLWNRNLIYDWHEFQRHLTGSEHGSPKKFSALVGSLFWSTRASLTSPNAPFSACYCLGSTKTAANGILQRSLTRISRSCAERRRSNREDSSTSSTTFRGGKARFHAIEFTRCSHWPRMFP
jgi:hypothetical protein